MINFNNFVFMKRTVVFLAAFLFAATAFAQTPEEILTRMEEEMDRHENEGIYMTVDVKVPVIGTMTTRSWMLGDKSRIEGKMMGVEIVTWTDGKTEWTYNSKNNEVEIKNQDSGKASTGEGDAEMFSDIGEGYDLSIKKETPGEWHILCKKSKDNTDKDAPKTVDLVIAKGTYYPKSLSTKISGISLTMREVSFGVTEKQVTFNLADFPGAKVIDKR